MAKITYGEKTNARSSTLPAGQKFGADEANEIKASVNALYDIIVSSANLTIADSPSDFPDASGGIRTIPDGASYLVTTAIDFEGDRLVLAGDASFIGVGTDISSLTSTGLGAAVPFITTTNGMTLNTITIKDVGTALDCDASATTSAIDWSLVNFENVATVGTFNTYDNAIFGTIGFLNSSGMSFEGTFGTIAFTNTLFNSDGGGTVLSFDSGVTITRRVRIQDSAFVIMSGETGINFPEATTVSGEGYIITNVSFSGGGTYLVGYDYTDVETLFSQCTGITNTSFIAGIYAEDNTTATTINTQNEYVKVAGTTVAASLNQKFTATANRLTYAGASTDTFKVNALVAIRATNGVDFAMKIFKNGLETTGFRGTTTGAGTTVSVNTSFETFLELANGDYIELYIANLENTSNVTVREFSFIVERS